jgi:hypothetical protein
MKKSPTTFRPGFFGFVSSGSRSRCRGSHRRKGLLTQTVHRLIWKLEVQPQGHQVTKLDGSDPIAYNKVSKSLNIPGDSLE